MKLSILIPVYNAEEYIGRCLDSLLDQDLSYTDYEIIIRDDGSTDGSATVIKSFFKKTSNILFTEDENRGAYVQRNILLNQASGDYIYFMDADDYVTRKSFNKILGLAFEHNLDIACFDVQLTTWKDSDTTTLKEKNTGNSDPNVVSGADYMEGNLEMRHEIWWYITKAEYLKNLGLTFEEGRFHNDVLFTIELFLNARRIAYFAFPIYYYYQSSGSIMRSSGNAHNDKLIAAGTTLVNSFTSYIDKLEKTTVSTCLLNNFKYKRDQYAFYLLLRMVKFNYPIHKIDEVKTYLKKMAVYPIKFYDGKDMSDKKFKILNTLFHNRVLLVMYLKLSKAGLIR